MEEIDHTEDYLSTLRAWLDRSDQHADELKTLTSPEIFHDRQRERRCAIEAIEEGIQRRVLIVGVAPGR